MALPMHQSCAVLRTFCGKRHSGTSQMEFMSWNQPQISAFYDRIFAVRTSSDTTRLHNSYAFNDLTACCASSETVGRYGHIYTRRNKHADAPYPIMSSNRIPVSPRNQYVVSGVLTSLQLLQHLHQMNPLVTTSCPITAVGSVPIKRSKGGKARRTALEYLGGCSSLLTASVLNGLSRYATSRRFVC